MRFLPFNYAFGVSVVMSAAVDDRQLKKEQVSALVPAPIKSERQKVINISTDIKT